MKHLHFECVGGASGDMILGALVELGAPLDALTSALATLGLAPFDLSVERGESFQITGVRLQVGVRDRPEAARPAEPHDHHHHHHHDHAPATGHAHHHGHRSLTDIEAMISGSPLPEPVKDRALAVFRALGRAEANIHGVPVERIHFHEVGADDSILDITGSCWALERLGIDRVSVGPIPQGQGVIQCAHGTFPNPAPATQELIAGMAVVQTDEPYELVTPTGAALLSVWRNAEAPPPGVLLKKTAYSLGKRQLNHRPNLLRASLYENAAGDAEQDTCLVLECNLDDTTPELIGVLMEDVLAVGALDVWCAPVTMKKQRPGMVLSVLCPTADREKLLEVILRGSTTFGVREYEVRRAKLGRRFETVATPYGDVRIKVGSWRGEDLTRAPEMADCICRAREHNIPVRRVYESAQRLAGRPAGD